MKLKDGIIQDAVGGDFYLVDSGSQGSRFNGMVKLNKTGAFIARALSESTDEETIADAYCREYSVTKEKALEDIEKIVSALRGAGLIDDE